MLSLVSVIVRPVIDVPYRDLSVDGIERIFVSVREGDRAKSLLEWIASAQRRYAPEAT